MPLKLYNTMTRRADEFRPITDNIVGLYTCGPTVYNFAHIGNLRTYVFEDILKRALLYEGFHVRHVMNVTDVGHLTSDADVGEDKMEKGAAREGKSVWDIAQFYWDAFKADMARLNLLLPDVWCRATDHIAEQVDLIRRLEEKGFTYITADGVYFDTSKLPDYGKLARLDIEGLKAGHRVEMAEGKRSPTDFALWKFSPKDKQRLMEWPSPWGVGFPGWHVECSAMSMKYLGERIDIHCGGIDHISVHHTNEIAQSESATGHPWVNWWMHGEFLVIPKGDDPGAPGAGGKMSKSSGEFLTLDVLVKKGYDPIAYRYFCLTAHYRQQLAFTFEGLDAAANAFARLTRTVLDLRPAYSPQTSKPLPAHMDAFRSAVEDDLNMPRALAAMWGAINEAAAGGNAAAGGLGAPDIGATKGSIYATLLEMDRVLGLGIDKMQAEPLGISPDEIQKLIDQRNAARKAKDFRTADEIRKKLADIGIALEDTAKGTVWHKESRKDLKSQI